MVAAPPSDSASGAGSAHGDNDDSAGDSPRGGEETGGPVVASALPAAPAAATRVSWRNASAAQVHVPSLLAGALRLPPRSIAEAEKTPPTEGDAAPPSATVQGPVFSVGGEGVASAAAAAAAPEPLRPADASSSPPADASSHSARPVQPPAASPAPPLPPADLNKLHSAAMRAQLAGDSAKHARIMQEIASIQAAAPPPPAPAAAAGHFGPAPPAPTAGSKRLRDDGSGEIVDVRVVSALDASGRPIRSLSSGPAQVQREDLRAGRRAGKLSGHANLHASDALTERQAWTRGDARETSLAELVREEASAKAGELDSTLARHISRAGAGWKKNHALQGSRAGFDEDDDGATDDLARLAEHPDARLTPHARQQKDLQRAAAADRRAAAATAGCQHCLDSPALQKHRIISLGEHAFLALPPGCGRLPGQLRIVPVPHVSAMTEADEEVRGPPRPPQRPLSPRSVNALPRPPRCRCTMR